MHPHEEFLELCASATVGELTADERAKLGAHLAGCDACRKAMSEYEILASSGLAALSSELATHNEIENDPRSAIAAEQTFFKRLERENEVGKVAQVEPAAPATKKGQRFTYRPSEIRWREVWMPFAAAILLALAFGIAAYRRGAEHGANVAGTTSPTTQEAIRSLEEQSSDFGYEHSQLLAKLNEDARLIEDLKRQLIEQTRIVRDLKAASATRAQSSEHQASTGEGKRNEQLAAAEAKQSELQKTIDDDTVRRQEVATRAAALETKISELTLLVRDREQALDQKQAEEAKQQELLEHDRDIRELMGARDLYVADVHDVAGAGKTNKTYGRVFYTKGKSLIFYAYDLDSQPGLRNASAFQAWGRRGPDKEQALNLGILYEDNASKKRWVLKAEDPKTLEDIDAVFVTVEPNGGSHYPSGKPLLFAFLRVAPNHP